MLDDVAALLLHGVAGAPADAPPAGFSAGHAGSRSAPACCARGDAVAVGAALLASHQLDPGPQSRGRPRRRRQHHGAGALQRAGRPGDRRPRLRARRPRRVPGAVPGGRDAERSRGAELEQLPGADDDAAACRATSRQPSKRVAAWQPATRGPRSSGPPVRRCADRERRPSRPARRDFDVVRAALGRLQADLRARPRADARADLAGAAAVAHACTGLRRGPARSGAGGLAVIGRQRAIAAPASHGSARRRAPWPAATCDRAIEPSGPRDIESPGRRRRVDARADRRRARGGARTPREQLRASRRVELERSNAELEQFAYVASHDLQEPLRKVASFCQLLERRYQGQLDERADQYIDFAVDGAKRMQALINDLLAFSRVGPHRARRACRSTLDGCSRQALDNLAAAIEETGATVEAPARCRTVAGDRALLVAAVPEPDRQRDQVPRRRAAGRPRRRPTRRRRSGTFAVRDNGIGIEPEYAERIFVIFQRLHAEGRLRGHRHRAGDVPARSSSTTAGGSGSTPSSRRRQRPSASPCPHRTEEDAPAMTPNPRDRSSTCCSSRTTRATCCMTREAFEEQQGPQPRCTSSATASRR